MAELVREIMIDATPETIWPFLTDPDKHVEWEGTVAEIMEPCSEDNTVAPETDTLEAMMKMQRTGRSPLLVVTRGQLVGILSLHDLLELLTLKFELEGDRRQAAARPQEG